MKKEMKKMYEDWILKNNHPCVMAQTVFSQENVFLKEYNYLGDQSHIEELYKDLREYLDSIERDDNQFKTFLAVFPKSDIKSEDEFEDLLWQELFNINKVDKVKWDPNVSSDPENENFSFSIGGKAFYIVGMHPKSSRLARQTPFPTIAFNLHSQFEKLRDKGAYQKVRNKIRDRDEKLQGFINPELEDFGTSSEARQYSGKNHEQEWKCPFHNSRN
ncbi:YqcI/YcgG family protein [Gramella sp. BOM4]|nr:YqcI/YcgG family protein [Christiangramia bathymodioli]